MLRSLTTLIVILYVGPTSAQSVFFASPNGLREECRVLPQIPGGAYSNKDLKKQQEFCSTDFYNTTAVALCPKTWSTSPGTMVYDISKTNLSQRDYETQAACGGTKSGHDTIAKFKLTMNQSDTSGTFAPSSLLYYHFSRYFDTSVNVPPAVYRSMDKDAHRTRVTEKAVSGNMGKSAMNRAGWAWILRGEQNPLAYKPTRDLFTADGQQIFGALVHGGGTRYGSEINGIRSAWGAAQNNDFQTTPAFWALRSAQPLSLAIHEGLERGLAHPQVRKDMGPIPSEFQMAIWMKELTEITLMDYILSQQDRIGNIDYKWELYTQDSNTGEVKSESVESEVQRANLRSIILPPAPRGVTQYLVQRTQISDNDAGGRVPYANFTKQTQMLQKIRHIHLETYRKLLDLAADLNAQGELYQYFKSHFLLDDRQMAQLVNNTVEAANIYKSICRSGQLHFDLHHAKALLNGTGKVVNADCDRP